MINYGQHKRFYTTGNEFITLTGGNYTGYVRVLSGVAYEDTMHMKLLGTERYETSLYMSEDFKNRSILDTFSLPYKEKDIIFSANDFMTHSLFIDKLGKLHDNNNFVYSRLFMANNNLPASPAISFAYLSSSNSTSFSASTTIVNNIAFLESKNEAFKQLGNVRRFVSRLNEEDPNIYSIFAITSSGFTTLTGTTTSCMVIEPYSPYVEGPSDGVYDNILTFGELYDITAARDFIFITDTANSYIYKYDVSGYYNGDYALANRRNLMEILGGDGPVKAKNLFKNPKHITSNDDIIIVNDSGNYNLKIYDINFNYLNKIATRPFRREPVAAIKINKFINYLYVLTYSTTINKLNLYIVDLDCYKVVETYKNIDITLNTQEEVQNIEFSYNNSDYYYICTNQQVYKLFVSRPSTLIGRFQELNLSYINGTTIVNDTVSVQVSSFGETQTTTYLNTWKDVNLSFKGGNWKWGTGRADTYNTPVIQGTQNQTVSIEKPFTFKDRFKNISFIPTSNNHDSVIIMTYSRIYFFNEPTTYKSVLKLNTFEKFGRANMSLSTDEYIQASTINKEIFKVVRDILTLKNNIVGRFNGAYDTSGVYTLDDYNYNLDYNSFTLAEGEDYYVHENEKATVEVLNRAFKNVYDLQLKLISLTYADTLNSVKKTSFVPSTNAGVLQIS